MRRIVRNLWKWQKLQSKWIMEIRKIRRGKRADRGNESTLEGVLLI